MEITEVRIFPTRSKDERLKAYATMTFDDWFVVRNVKVIQGNSGLFVAMPSRKMMDPCRKCGFKNVRGSKYCGECGSHLDRPPAVDNDGKRQSEHVDIAHPIKQECRVYIQDKVLEAYNAEVERKKTEGKSYKPAADESFDTVSFQRPEGEGAAEEAPDIEL